jgi:putative ABC transport system permease protein
MRSSWMLVAALSASACEKARTEDTPRVEQLPDRDRVLAIVGHVTVMKTAVFDDYRRVTESVMKVNGVASAQPAVLAEMTGTGRGAPVTFMAKGIDPVHVPRTVTAVTGSVGTLRTKQILLGAALAKKLGVKVGDEIRLGVTMNPITQAPGPVRVLGVGGTFECGVDGFDGNLAYVDLATLQEIVGDGDAVTTVEVRVSDIEAAAAIAEQIEQRIGSPQYRVLGWRALNPNI